MAAATLLVAACGKRFTTPEVPPFDEAEKRPGGDTTTGLGPFPDFERPAANLPGEAKPRFFAGKALAEQPWVKAPTTTTARDGLGPLYNAQTCFDCHEKGSRGFIAERAGTPLHRGVVRLSIPGQNETDGAEPEPTYGLQLQTQSTSLRHQLREKIPNANALLGLAAEARVLVDWVKEPFRYPDGREVSLFRPRLSIEQLGDGPLHPEVRTSLRVAPPIFGVGLIELVDEKAIEALADPDDENDDGISGRVNRVWDFRAGRIAQGRFGYKANRASLEITVAGAFADDIGISNPIFDRQPCSPVQAECQREPHGVDAHGFELGEELLALAVDFNRNLGVPERRGATAEAALRGRRVFHELGCAACHAPRFVTIASTTAPHLGNQVVWPYSDFLLHDMGEGLADGRPDYEASGSEWRTAPLWGLRLGSVVSGTENYLHDGRARSIEEAILWHGGEAAPAQRRFTERPLHERNDLIAFLRSL
jgi:CxxC motif-containing protein (DUF1111 family)